MDGLSVTDQAAISWSGDFANLFPISESLLWWFLAMSVLSLLITLIVVPLVLVRLPADYFSLPDRHHVLWQDRNRFLRIPYFLLKNLIGLAFVLIGILMLALPGQGVLSILIGLILMEFPGKYRAVRWIVHRPPVLGTINWIRAKAGKGKLI